VEGQREIMIRTYVLYITAVVVMLVIIGRVIAIQYGNVVVDNRPYVEGDSTRSGSKLDSIIPMRGRILADDGSVLVTSIPLYDISVDLSVIDASLFEEVDSLAIMLERYFPDKSRVDWERELTYERGKKNKYHRIAREVKYDVINEVRNFPIFREGKLNGGYIEEKTSQRHMPYGMLAQRTLGYTREGAKPVGLEGSFNDWLDGECGLMMKEWVSNGWKPVTGDYVRDPVDGADIITSIDVDIQDVAENELKRMLEKQSAAHGSVILMEVETGFIKAIANLTMGSDSGYYETFNHAVGTRTDPGSTFKLASLMALLEDGLADITDTVNAVGSYRFYNHITRDHRREGYGRITLRRAFEVSSNVFSKVINDAYKNQPQKFVDRLKSFGLADSLGLDIAGEPMPYIKDVGENGWSGITLPQMAIGYEVELTPLQMLAFYNAVANGGELIRPQFVREIRRDGKTVKSFEKQVIKEKICSDITLAKVRECLEGVVENGTGKNLQSANFKIGGKTGTAKIVMNNTGYGDDYQASFIGYFPADKPKYSLSVVIAGPTRQIYGAEVSGTVFTAIANKVYSSSPEYHPNYNQAQIPDGTSLPEVKSGNLKSTKIALDKIGIRHTEVGGSEYVAVARESGRLRLIPRSAGTTTVPDVVGMALNDAIYLLENAGLRVKVSGSGKVTDQSQRPGMQLIKGTAIELKLG